jgi:HD-GYP domain-containing protein (c-di-GMP phosphodiesterase class II)
MQRIWFAGLVHDIGKINIPESILTKPGQLSIEEYAIIQTHPNVGYRMLEKIEELAALKNGVLYHHERWDGKGYPAGKKGLDIPLDARVLTIADAFDAMTSSRSYRDALTIEEAFERLISGAGTQFDPQLIENLKGIRTNIFKI